MLLRSMAGSMSGSSPHSSPHQAEHDVEILIATFLRRIHSASCTTNWGIARLPMPLPLPLSLPLPACLTGYWHCPGLFEALLLLLLALMLFGRHLIYGKCSRWQAAKHFQLNDCILAPCGKLSSVHTHTPLRHRSIYLYIQHVVCKCQGRFSASWPGKFFGQTFACLPCLLFLLHVAQI